MMTVIHHYGGRSLMYHLITAAFKLGEKYIKITLASNEQKFHHNISGTSQNYLPEYNSSFAKMMNKVRVD
jgi:hypothetical protein